LTPSEAVSLDEPSEISLEDYIDLVRRIRRNANLVTEDSPVELAPSDNDDDSELVVWTVDRCRSELLEAARYDEIDLVRAILRVHPRLATYQNPDSGNTALHMASANGHANVVKLLLSLAPPFSDSAPSSTCTVETTSSSSTQQSLIMIPNKSGNTPLHWAAANGREEIVALLLSAGSKSKSSCGADGDHGGVDVLKRNAFGRSALTEGFASDNADVIQTLLEHESAAEERLLETNTPAGTGTNTEEGALENENGNDDSITHTLVLGQERQLKDDNMHSINDDNGCDSTAVKVRVRERAMAHSCRDMILAEGADRPQDDTTGLGIWSSSIVAAQWMVDVVASKANANAADVASFSILELGAGCGLPSLVLAKLCPPIKIYATDFNDAALSNLRHNILLNNCDGELDDRSKEQKRGNITVLLMNWQEESTWPQHKIDYIVGSDLVYQSNMVPLLVATLKGLLKVSRRARFWYVAPSQSEDEDNGGNGSNSSRRQGHGALLEGMAEAFDTISSARSPPRYSRNPLESQDDEECFLHFNDLQSANYVLYEFAWKPEYLRE